LAAAASGRSLRGTKAAAPVAWVLFCRPSPVVVRPSSGVNTNGGRSKPAGRPVQRLVAPAAGAPSVLLTRSRPPHEQVCALGSWGRLMIERQWPGSGRAAIGFVDFLDWESRGRRSPC
jgi:hypothetical protein